MEELKNQGKNNKNQRKKYIGFGIISAVVLVFIVTAIYTFKKEDKPVEIPGYVVLDEENPTLKAVLKEDKVILESIGHYTGLYVEDGSDSEKEGILAILVKNDGKQMIEDAEICLDFGASGIAEFVIKKLPAGKSALVLNRNKLTYAGEPTARYIEEKIIFSEEKSKSENFELSKKEKELTLKNKTDKEYSRVNVYYKTKLAEDIFLGGISYQTVFEMIPAEGEVTQKALHCSSETSEIVFVEIAE